MPNLTQPKRSNNRAISLTGANTIFNAVDVQIEALPTGGYQSRGRVVATAKTLTALCQEVARSL